MAYLSDENSPSVRAISTVNPTLTLSMMKDVIHRRTSVACTVCQQGAETIRSAQSRR